MVGDGINDVAALVLKPALGILRNWELQAAIQQ
jgi:soluble P-type ATPase